MRILIAICSATFMHERRKACRETWVQDVKALAPSIDYRFFVGESEDGKEEVFEEDVVQLKCNDSYNQLPEKIRAILQWVDENCEYDYVFKCDDDTYVVPDRLERLVSNGEEYVGDVMAGIAGYGGSGYFLSRNAVKNLLAPGVVWRMHGLEDLLVGELCSSLGIQITKGVGLCGGCYPIPAKNNEVVTNHSVPPEDFYWRRECFDSDVLVGKIRLNVREDEATFFHNGTFAVRGFLAGSWKYNPECITVDYNKQDKHCPLVFTRATDCIFISGERKLIFEQDPDDWMTT